jgi:hypothetical protein
MSKFQPRRHSVCAGFHRFLKARAHFPYDSQLFVVWDVGLWTVVWACVQGKAVNVMADRILSSVAATGERVTLLATGCLTNVALLLTVYPEVKEALNRIGAWFLEMLERIWGSFAVDPLSGVRDVQ